MSKFKVGDRVKCVDSDWLPFRHVGTIIEDDKTGLPFLVRFDDWYEGHGEHDNECWVSADAVDHAYTSCAAAEVDNLADEYGGPNAASKGGFKAGDKVQASKSFYGVAKPGDTATVTEKAEYWCDICQARLVDVVWDRKTGGHMQSDGGYYLANIEHVSTPATLRIEAGKFYKTRDGRKVGPMRDDVYGWMWATVDGATRSFRVDDGKHGYIESLDLVAEWTDLTIADIVARHSASGTAIVAVLEGGLPRPATRPYVHTTVSAAETEASRLARTNPGKEFGVYTLGPVAKVERVYDHEWQRLAANGSKIDGIKELRRVSGLGLAIAKDAVEDWLRRAA
ncbi:hypothetical protein [Mesorhizobium sp.]|uniref:hypothetical protein n=1 Tax=Mesorhizobium sp. TaxID=1871066 RepID=UPI0012221AF4|nr:hypothetical protein [Mesorhizobium sp.]TIN83056.1 MAG: hypothetical protein E5X97_27365 [Mesorhizobium sp.]